MAKQKNGESEFFKRKQVCVKGITLKKFEYDVEQQEGKESSVIFNIMKEYYKTHTPLGFNSTSPQR